MWRFAVAHHCGKSVDGLFGQAACHLLNIGRDPHPADGLPDWPF
jgi:hypothetical protein